MKPIPAIPRKGLYPLPLAVFLLATASATPALALQGSLTGLLVKAENIVFTGNKDTPTEDLRTILREAGTVTANLPVERMDVYDGNRLTHAINMLAAFYRNRGFVKATIGQPEFDLGSEAETRVRLRLAVSEGTRYELEDIRIVGATALSPAVLTSLLNLQKGRPVNLSKINIGALAIRETYLTLGYLDVVISPALDAPEGKRRATLTVRIEEGKQYRVGEISFVGPSVIKESLLREFLPLKTGDMFGQKAFEGCLASLNELGITPLLTPEDADFDFDSGKGTVNVAIHLNGKTKEQK
ncbi:MAG: POTRA domain-containing protein [Acidobacteriota bacterium]